MNSPSVADKPHVISSKLQPAIIKQEACLEDRQQVSCSTGQETWGRTDVPEPLACEQCDFLGLARTLRLHQLLGCHAETPTTSDNKKYDQTTQQHSIQTSNPAKSRYQGKDQVFPCDKCDSTFFFQSHLRNHIKRHVEKVFQCSWCSFTCHTLAIHQTHKKTHSRERRFSCTICCYKSRRSYSLKQHILIHNKGKPYSCTRCSFVCNQLVTLKQHAKTHTEKTAVIENKCNQCDFVCKRPSLLRKHVVKHTRKEPLKCSFCRIVFKYPNAFKKHLLIHSEETNYSCESCSFTCFYEDEFKIHCLTHNIDAEKVYSCQNCSFKCNLPSILKLHSLIHK